MAKFEKKKPENNEDAILIEYVKLNREAKELEKRIAPLKKVVLAIVKARGSTVAVSGMTVTVASRPKRKFSDALEAEIERVREQQDFIDIKVKRAVEDKDFTIIDLGEYVIIKAAKREED